MLESSHFRTQPKYSLWVWRDMNACINSERVGIHFEIGEWGAPMRVADIAAPTLAFVLL